ncbi:MAG TPA: CBS domain-containing protein [Actinomycetospora sp.]|nr:CBS domain-containing protein [Actinomycetospora sp.]
MHIAALMRRFVVTVGPDTTLDEVEDLLLETGFAIVPVVDDHRLVGVVGLDDIPLPPACLPVPMPRHARGRPRVVREVMVTAVTTTTSTTHLADLVRLLRVTGLSSVPVVDGEGLAGIVTRRDVADALGGVPSAARRRLLAVGAEDRRPVPAARTAADPEPATAVH